VSDQSTKANTDGRGSAYTHLKTEVLEMIIRQDAMQTGENVLDTNELLEILDILVARADEQGAPCKTAEEALAEFKEHYLPAHKYDTVEFVVKNTPAPSPNKKKHIIWVRRLATVAALLVVVLIGSSTASALGYDIWKEIFEWTENTFSFSGWSQPGDLSASEDQPLDDFTPLNVNFEEFGIPAFMMPTSIPGGFSEKESFSHETEALARYTFVYENTDRNIILVVSKYKESNPVKQEKSDDLFEIREINGISYFVFSNVDRCRITWQYENYECYISGDISLADINNILNSLRRE